MLLGGFVAHFLDSGVLLGGFVAHFHQPGGHFDDLCGPWAPEAETTPI